MGNCCLEFIFYEELKINETITDVVKNYNDAVCGHSKWIDFNGWFEKKLGIQGLYKSMWMYILGEDYIVSSSGKTTANYKMFTFE